MNFEINQVKFDDSGLIPAVIQDSRTREVLTLAYMNAASLRRTVETKQTWFWSRSRQQLWHKGETSGNTQKVIEVLLDCDRDALVVLVAPEGPACHTGQRTCFHNTVEQSVQGLNSESGPLSSRNPPSEVDEGHSGSHKEDLGALLDSLYNLIESRKRERPEGSYTTYLFDEGLDKILKKIGEESAETIVAAKNKDPHAVVSETSDLLYHLLVLLVERGISLAQISQELARRGQEKNTND
jgi:phosphoribosyl-AMP cyclohydrolase / phosphoribosyl-ATP pyrophosphohydrolase